MSPGAPARSRRQGRVVDTSVAVPFLMRSHAAHTPTHRRLSRHRLHLTTHSLAETYAVLTRLPGDARLAPQDAARLLDANFAKPLPVAEADATALPRLLAALAIAGGAVYDALVALAARHGRLTLATRDRRAAATYTALDVEVDWVGD